MAAARGDDPLDDAVFVSLGSGVGVSIVSGGNLLRGAFGECPHHLTTTRETATTESNKMLFVLFACACTLGWMDVGADRVPSLFQGRWKGGT